MKETKKPFENNLGVCRGGGKEGISPKSEGKCVYWWKGGDDLAGGMFWRRLIAPVTSVVAGTAFSFDDIDTAERHLWTREKSAIEVIDRFMVQHGVPGLSIGVSVDGRRCWSRGFGWSDVEQLSPCRATSVMRIASISKPITALIAARLVAAQRLDLDADIRKYLPDFPEKNFEKKPVTITSRQLLSHNAGIRHYHQNAESKKNASTEIEAGAEYFSRKQYKTVTEALEMFAGDELVAAPGTKFEYTTHGYTLLSAVLEKADGRPYLEQLKELLALLGMNNTRTDTNSEIIPERARYYRRNATHSLENVPEVDNSYKWAGGGILSNVEDLLIFADAILYAYQSSPESLPKPIIDSATIREFWRLHQKQKKGEDAGYGYGLGWGLREPRDAVGGPPSGRARFGFWSHSGGAVGATSILLVRPRAHLDEVSQEKVAGVTVAILVNLQDCKGLANLALEISEIFADF